MGSILRMALTSTETVAAVIPGTSEITKNSLSVFEREKKLLQNVILHLFCI